VCGEAYIWENTRDEEIIIVFFLFMSDTVEGESRFLFFTAGYTDMKALCLFTVLICTSLFFK